MARYPTTYSRVSTGYKDSKNTIAESGYDLGFIDAIGSGTLQSSNLSATGLLAGATAAIFSMTTLSGGISVGGGDKISLISSKTAAISLGAIAPLESSSVVTVAGPSGTSRGDALFITVDSIYPVVAANRDVHWMCSSSSTAGEVHVWGVNSTLTSVTPTASTVVRITRIGFPSYL